MKTSAIALLVTSLAGAASASPAVEVNKMHERSEQVESGIFGDQPNIVNGVFNTAACFVSGIIGQGKQGNPNCKGKGTATVETPAGKDAGGKDAGGKDAGGKDAGGKGGKGGKDGDDGKAGGDKGQPSSGGDVEDTRYNFNYDTNKDGTLKISITLGRGGDCQYPSVKADGQQPKAVIDKLAKECLAKKT